MNAMTDQMEQLTGQLRQEFAEDAQEMLDRLDSLSVETTDREGESGTPLHEARRIVHALRGAGGTHDFPDLTIIAMRAEEYLGALDALGDAQSADLQAFTDAMRRALRGERQGAGAFKDEVRQLPSHSAFNVGDVEIREVEVLLVTTAKVVAHKVRNELQACGYRVATVSNPVMALELAIRTQPDLVVASTMLDVMTGVDLARALGAISATEHLHFALMTSFSHGHPQLAGLPVDAGVIRVGAHFADDVADVMSRFEIG